MPIKIITANVNGIRSAARKGFFAWLEKENPDVVCLQETKAHITQLTDHLFQPKGYYSYFHDAEKKGYSGVAIYTRVEPKKIETKLGWSCADQEGRYVQVDYENIKIASLYMPSGTSGDHRQTLKYEFMDCFYRYLEKIKNDPMEYIICGDWNIAHTQKDLKNWKANQNYTGFLPEERAWLDKVFNELQLVDAFRVVNQEADQYTWWSNFGRAWEKNVGWRIDYQIVTPGLRDKILSASIYKDERFSDHAPLIMNYDWSLE